MTTSDYSDVTSVTQSSSASVGEIDDDKITVKESGLTDDRPLAEGTQTTKLPQYETTVMESIDQTENLGSKTTDQPDEDIKTRITIGEPTETDTEEKQSSGSTLDIEDLQTRTGSDNAGDDVTTPMTTNVENEEIEISSATEAIVDLEESNITTGSISPSVTESTGPEQDQEKDILDTSTVVSSSETIAYTTESSLTNEQTDAIGENTLIPLEPATPIDFSPSGNLPDRTTENISEVEETITDRTIEFEDITTDKTTEFEDSVTGKITELEDVVTAQTTKLEETDTVTEISPSTDIPSLITSEPASSVTEGSDFETVTKSPLDNIEKEDTAATVPPILSTSLPTSVSSSTTEINQEVVTTPSGIPGEGDCMINSINYQTGDDIPPTSVCEESCLCRDSVVVCKFKSCPPAPPAFLRCSSSELAGECCPSYDCRK